MTTLSIVIPAYNEENGIAEIIQRVLSTEPDLAQAGVAALELLVVDDGSADQTAAITGRLAETNPNLRLIKHARNKGYGAALKTGFGAASGELVGFLDADGTYPPEHFPQLCQAARAGAELVIGSRMAGADSQMPMTRRIGNLFFATLLSIVGRQRVTDSASGMRVFQRDLLGRIYPLPDGLNLTPVMSTRAIHEGVRMVEVPIPYSERVGSSKLSVIRDGTLFLQSMLWTVMTYNPVRILGLIGLSGITFGLLSALGLVILRLQGVTDLTNWTVGVIFAGVIATVLGLNLFCLGITFNYLVSLFHRKTIRQGLFGQPIFKKPLDRHFGWLGLLGSVVGFVAGAISLILSFSGWDLDRLWLYLLGSASLLLMGSQLVVYWIILRVLDELNQRAALTAQDMAAT